MRNGIDHLMKRRPARWAARLLLVIGVGCGGLAGCDEVMSGHYDEANGWGGMEFRGKTVYVTVAIVGSTFAATYDVQGNHVIVDGGGGGGAAGGAGVQSFRIEPDGSLRDANGLRFVRRPVMPVQSLPPAKAGAGIH